MITLSTAATSSNFPSTVSNVPVPSTSLSTGSSIRLSLKRSYSTINQLHQSLGNSTVANGSLLSAVVSGSSTQAIASNGRLAVHKLKSAASSKAPHSGRVPIRSRSLQPSQQPQTERKYTVASPSPKRRRSSLAVASDNDGMSTMLTPVMGHASLSPSFHSPSTSSATTVDMPSLVPIIAPDFPETSSRLTLQQNSIPLSNQLIFCSPVVS